MAPIAFAESVALLSESATAGRSAGYAGGGHGRGPRGGIFAHVPPWPATPPLWAIWRRPATSGRPPERVGQTASKARMSGLGRIWPGKKRNCPRKRPPGAGRSATPRRRGLPCSAVGPPVGAGRQRAIRGQESPKRRHGAVRRGRNDPRQGSARAKVSGFGRIWPGKKRNGRGSGGSFRAVDGIGSQRRPRFRELDGTARATPATTYCRQDGFQPPEIAACAASRMVVAPDGLRVGLGKARAAALHTSLF